LHDTDYMDTQDVRDVITRTYVLAARTSFMVEGPNRWAHWAISQWNEKRREWDVIADGKSKVKDRPLKKRYPSALG
jgi:hypothetical protein